MVHDQADIESVVSSKLDVRALYTTYIRWKMKGLLIATHPRAPVGIFHEVYLTIRCDQYLWLSKADRSKWIKLPFFGIAKRRRPASASVSRDHADEKSKLVSAWYALIFCLIWLRDGEGGSAFLSRVTIKFGDGQILGGRSVFLGPISDPLNVRLRRTISVFA